MGSTRANVVFASSVVFGLGVFAAVILIGSGGHDLSWTRLGAAGAALIASSTGCAWVTGRTFLR